MAQIDLRSSEITIRDGYTATAAVNQTVTPPANGNTSFTIDGISKAIPDGVRFTVVGSTDTYTVVSSTGGATPTAITFTPALATAKGIPADNAVITFQSRRLVVKLGEGNVTFNVKRSMEYVKNKRSIETGFVRAGDDEPLDVKIDAIWEFLASDSGEPPSIEEVLNQTGGASSWVSSGGDPCEPYCVDIEIRYTPPCTGVKGETILIKEYRWESMDHDLKAGTISTSGKCKKLFPTIVRE
jgi:hypothetical protein